MPWNETCVMDERVAFVRTYLRGDVSMTELCADYGISRKTGYKWLDRYQQEGGGGLGDRRRTPHAHPKQLPEEVVQRCISLKLEKPNWGPKKLIALGRRRDPHAYWPAASTLGEHLKRHGLVKPKRRRNYSTPPYERGLIDAQAPNDVWCADFKGQFRTRDRKYCFPLTVTDASSRYVLSCLALPDVSSDGAWPEFERIFRAYGLPKAIRTDNGTPFAALRLGYSRLSLWWMRLGIIHERIDCGHPEQNGRHERMHKTLKAETTRPPQRNLVNQQQRFERWREEFNQERPHEALGQTTPASHYVPSSRPYLEKLPEVAYPSTFEVRRVRSAGEILWRDRRIYIGRTLIGELIGLERVDEARWQVWFIDLKVGILDERLKRVLPMYPV